MNKKFLLFIFLSLLLSSCGNDVTAPIINDAPVLREVNATGEWIPSGSHYQISWDPVAGASDYLIEESNRRDFLNKKEYTTSETSYTIINRDGEAKVNFYRVCPENSLEPRPWSNVVRVVTGDGDDKVVFGDSVFESAMIEVLSKRYHVETDVITLSDLDRIDYYIRIEDKILQSIEEVVFCRNMTSFLLYNSQIDAANLQPVLTHGNINSLTINGVDLKGVNIFKQDISLKITFLDLYTCGITDISDIGNHTNFLIMGLAFNNISDISGIAGLVNMVKLTLWGNNITDISALENLVLLEYLNIRNNFVTDISVLQGLSNLSGIDLAGNGITDISVLKNLIALEEIDLSNNQIADISSLQNLTALEEIDLSNNQITDISPLADNQYFGSSVPCSPNGDCVYLDLRNNLLDSVSLNVHIPKLRSKFVNVAY